MKIINNAKEFKAYYPYKSPPNPKPCPKKKDYPKRYPCACEIEDHDGGIGGDYMTVEIFYPPKGCDFASFVAGLMAAKNIKKLE